MTIPVFPALQGQGFVVHKKPTFSTILAPHVSGREVRNALYANPIWSFEVTFDGLDGTPSGQFGGLGAQSLQALMGLFLQCQGQFGAFLYYDPTDYQVAAEAFATSDGSTVSFQLSRNLGGFNEPIVAPVTMSSTLAFPGGVTDVVEPALVSATIGGLPASVPSYTISATGGTVTFESPPANGMTLAWSGAFGFLCRFDTDDLDFEQFMTNLWQATSVKFRSVRSQ